MDSPPTELIVTPAGAIRALYDETLDWHAFGPPAIRRASHVEPTRCGRWLVDLTPVGGPLLGVFARRSDALAAEVRWLRDHWLAPRAGDASPTA